MNSRERVEKAINFQTPDRVPIDLGGLKASGIASIAYDRVKKALGIDTPTRVFDARFLMAVVEEEVMRRLHVDVAPLDVTAVPFIRRPEREWAPRTLFDGTRVLFPPETRITEDAEGNWLLLDRDGSPTSFKMPKGGYYFDDVSFDRGDPIDPAKFHPIDDVSDEQLEMLSSYGKWMYDSTDYALLGWGYGVCFIGLSLITDRKSNVTMGQPSDWMVMLMTEKETCHEMMNRSVEATINCLEMVNQAVGDYCFAWGIAADDSGTQRGEFLNPELWAEMIKPHYTKLCDWIHRNTKMKTFFHSCGSVYHLIPHFIEAGIDILNPVQTSAANMDPARLKAEFGDKIVFWGGGCDTQHVLGSATPEEVYAHVQERLRLFAPGGGYVFNQVHNIQADVPPENILAMFAAAYDGGQYG
ncbi:MAG: uroporphyrinogen decarboxylase family protein [Armatimonadota bacterium]